MNLLFLAYTFNVLSIIAGTNAGHAFGQVGIGVYDKRYFRRRGQLHVEFKHRSRAIQKNVDRIQLKVGTAVPSVADDTIRQWLNERHARKRVTKVFIDSLINREVDEDVKATSYLEYQNSCKKGKRSRPGQSVKQQQPTSSTAMQKLQRARYREHKRIKRAQKECIAQSKVST